MTHPSESLRSIPSVDDILNHPELAAWLQDRQLARQKFPERLEIVSEFPMTPSGKIQKFRLRQLVAERLAAERERRA